MTPDQQKQIAECLLRIRDYGYSPDNLRAAGYAEAAIQAAMDQSRQGDEKP